MAKKDDTITIKDALDALGVLTKFLSALQDAGADIAVDDTEDDEAVGEDTVVAAERTRLEGLGIRALRKEAKEAGFDPDDIKDATKDDLVEALVEHFASDEEEVEDEDDADETDDSEDEDTEPGEDEEDEDESGDEGDEEDGEGYTESALNDMSLAEVKALLKENEWTAADLKGKTKEDLIAEYGEYIGFAEEDEGGDEDEADEEEDDALDEDALRAMSLKDLKALAKEYDVKVPRGADKDGIVDAILEQAGEEDDEDGDEPPF